MIINTLQLPLMRLLLMKISLITRKNESFKGKLAFSGGFLDKEETLKDCCICEVFEETNLSVAKQDLNFEMFLDNPYRDSRGRVLSVVFRWF